MSIFDAPPIEHWNKEVKQIQVIELPTLDRKNPNLRAITFDTNGVCHIVLKKYPECLAHEMRHCLEGNWHGAENNDSWCDNEKY